MQNLTMSLMVTFFANFTGEHFDRARKLREKMRTNLVMARDRLEVLGE